jgi:hypothetical protein
VNAYTHDRQRATVVRVSVPTLPTDSFGPITFIVPSSRANARYFKWLLVHQPALLFNVLLSHLPFAFQLVRRFAQAAAGDPAQLARAHEAGLSALAQKSGLGDKLRAIDAAKSVRAYFVQAIYGATWQLAKFAGVGLLAALFAAGLWATASIAITEWRAGLGLKALLFLALNFLFLSGAVAGIAFAWLRQSPDPGTRPLRRAAARLAELLKVPVVTFGHTHEEGIWRAGDAWYFNTGTWIAVFTHDVLLPRERVQFTFLRIRGEGAALEAELLHWSPGRGKPLPVILLEEEAPDVLPEPPGALPPS